MRILLKLSGESLKGEKEFGIDPDFVEVLVKKIKTISDYGNQIAIVIGGGNIYRGSNLIAAGVQPADSHNLSMLSTVFNGVVLKNFFEKIGQKARVFNPLGIDFLEAYNKDIVQESLEQGEIAILVGGTGNPFFTTDTGGVLRSLELNCEMMIKATKVDGIYDKDPVKHSDAVFYSKISYEEVLEKDLKILDQTAVALAKSAKHKIGVVNILSETAITDMLAGKKVGSIIS